MQLGLVGVLIRSRSQDSGKMASANQLAGLLITVRYATVVETFGAGCNALCGVRRGTKSMHASSMCISK
jgi:hypothetical protein